jgi:hypothetical protein
MRDERHQGRTVDDPAAADGGSAGVRVPCRSTPAWRREQITRFFDGLDLVEPGVVHLPDWHPDEPVRRPLDISGLLFLGALARKP